MASLDFESEKIYFRRFYDSNRADLDGALVSFRGLLRSLLASKPNIAISDVEGRIKDRDECLRKFTRKYRTNLESSKTPYAIRDHITDLVGLRIVCLYEDDIEPISQLVEGEFDVINITNKILQIEGTEDSFGYKGLHLDLKLNSVRREMLEYCSYADYPFELQIRTVVQDSWSIIDHKIKYKKSIPNSLKRRINTLAALFELADREFRAIRDATKAEIEKAEPYDQIDAETGAFDVTVMQEAEEKEKSETRGYVPLDAFNFLRIACHFFSAYDFEPHKVDGFTQEIINLKPGISRGKFNFYLRNTISNVKRYQEDFQGSGGDEMNPYTVMRHCLYAGDKEVFAPMLTDIARDRFDSWLTRQGGRI